MKINYKTVFEPQEEGGFTATVPALPGCISQGDTYDEALVNIKEAIDLYIETLTADGRQIPEENHLFIEIETSIEKATST